MADGSAVDRIVLRDYDVHLKVRVREISDGSYFHEETLTYLIENGTIEDAEVEAVSLASDEPRKVSADPDTVERVARAIHEPACGCDGSLHSPEEWDAAFCGWARAALNAIGGGGQQ